MDRFACGLGILVSDALGHALNVVAQSGEARLILAHIAAGHPVQNALHPVEASAHVLQRLCRQGVQQLLHDVLAGADCTRMVDVGVGAHHP
ncbi:hypothetical protein [Methylobacterium sp. WSM2598]|uniref:hypothetical protein n=1 Tax=Methylobacterium sp. WSM2598 TaxID=398261 RepID=UPI000475A379|nr:hypothetical protein [Methylobacterium sp. WSM2598]